VSVSQRLHAQNRVLGRCRVAMAAAIGEQRGLGEDSTTTRVDRAFLGDEGCICGIGWSWLQAGEAMFEFAKSWTLAPALTR